MRALPLVIALAGTPAAQGRSIADEFPAGFGGVDWGTKCDDLVQRFPGGYEILSVHSGGLAYAINIEDSVLGLARAGLYVSYAMNLDRVVDEISIRTPYEQAQPLTGRLTSRFGPAIRPTVHGAVSAYQWPTDQGMTPAIRFSTGGAAGLATLDVHNPVERKADPKRRKTH
ncbi:MAG: hypothetical protein JSR54_02375 [Proteobacteria bacterium]|nr:hypothetical protein [Pseudomonadota bacterium]